MRTLKAAAIFTVMGAMTIAIQAATLHHVTVAPDGDKVFAPAHITVELGDTVRWTWEDGSHNVVSGQPGSPDGAFFSGPPADEGTVYEVVFDQALLGAFPMPGNIYDYHCQPHADDGMIGSVTVNAPPACPWDLTGDNTVGPADLAVMLGNWGPCPGCPADINEDGAVDPADLAALLGNWGLCI